MLTIKVSNTNDKLPNVDSLVSVVDFSVQWLLEDTKQHTEDEQDAYEVMGLNHREIIELRSKMNIHHRIL